MKKINITIEKEQLQNLYNEQGKSRCEIGKMYGISVTTVQRLLNKYEIEKNSTIKPKKT